MRINNKGFTGIELLVALAIIVALGISAGTPCPETATPQQAEQAIKHKAK